MGERDNKRDMILQNKRDEDSEGIRKKLLELQDVQYRDFTLRLLPGIRKEDMIGVRLPKLRKMASGIAAGDWKGYLNNSPMEWFEEKMLCGMIIGSADMTLKERFEWVNWFIPCIDNWSVCDSFCAGLKFTRYHKDMVWEQIKGWYQSEEPYRLRTAAVMTLDYFAEEAYAKEAFEYFRTIPCEHYYVQMAVAWAVSVFYVNCPDITYEFLKENRLHESVYKKAIQKIRESYRVEQAEKERVKQLLMLKLDNLS